MWHYEDSQKDDQYSRGRIELSLDELLDMIRVCGFDLGEISEVETTYLGDSRAMLDYIYKAQFWIATKI